MAKNFYKHYDLKQAKRLVLPIDTFGGVDYSSQKFQVSPNRAIDLINFIYKDGVVQKREGYTEKAVVPTIKYIEYPLKGTSPYDVFSNADSKQFNGVWHFLAEDGEYHTVAHIGELLFEIKNLDGKIVEFELLTADGDKYGKDLYLHPVTYRHLNQKSMAFVGNNRLWFLGGERFMLIGFTNSLSKPVIYEPVEESSYTFVPTTTVSITYKNSIIKARTAFDYANNMTMWRKNTCLSGTGKDESDPRQTKYYEYTLDAPIKTKDSKEDVERLAEVKSLASISEETQKALSKIRIKVEELVTKEQE